MCSIEHSTTLSNHRNKVCEYCNKTTSEVIYKILKTSLWELRYNEVTAYVNLSLDIFKYYDPYSKPVFSFISGFHHG